MTVSTNKSKTMKALVRDLARHQKAGHKLDSSDFMIDLAKHIDFQALERILESHGDLVTVATYLRDMAEHRIIPRDLQDIRPILAKANDARFQYRERRTTIKFVI